MTVRKIRILVASTPQGNVPKYVSKALKALGRKSETVQLIDVRDALGKTAGPGDGGLERNTFAEMPLHQIPPINLRQALELCSQQCGTPEILFLDVPAYAQEPQPPSSWIEAGLNVAQQRGGTRFVPMGSSNHTALARSLGFRDAVTIVGAKDDAIVADIRRALESVPSRDDTLVLEYSPDFNIRYAYLLPELTLKDAYNPLIQRVVTERYATKSLETLLADAMILLDAGRERVGRCPKDGQRLYAGALARLKLLSERLSHAETVPEELTADRLVNRLQALPGVFHEDDPIYQLSSGVDTSYTGPPAGIVGLWAVNVALHSAWPAIMRTARTLDPAAESGIVYSLGWDPQVLKSLQDTGVGLCDLAADIARTCKNLPWSPPKIAHALRQKGDVLVALDGRARAYNTINDILSSGDLDPESHARVLVAGLSGRGREAEGQVWAQNESGLTAALEQAGVYYSPLVELYRRLAALPHPTPPQAVSHALVAHALSYCHWIARFAEAQFNMQPHLPFREIDPDLSDPAMLLHAAYNGTTTALADSHCAGSSKLRLHELQLATAYNLFGLETWGRQHATLDPEAVLLAAQRIDTLGNTSFRLMAEYVYPSKQK